MPNAARYQPAPALLLALGLSITAPPAPAQHVASGTALPIRLTSPVGSKIRKAGDSVFAEVIAPVLDSGRVAIAPGTKLLGVVAGAGIEQAVYRRHFLDLHFTRLAESGMPTAPIRVRVLHVDNAREVVDSTGRILGPPIPNTLHSKLTWGLLVLGVWNPIVAAALFASIQGESHELHRAIRYPPGTEMEIVTLENTPLPGWTTWQPPPPVADSQTFADSVLDFVPPRATAFGGGVPADLIDFIFIGSRKQIESAFKAAGWDRAEKLDVRTGFDVFIDAMQARGYDHQPVSTLLLGGRPPDVVYQKLTDTFAKRHHIRIWRRSDLSWGGRDVFVAAASHDVGLTFLPKEHAFSHQVDGHIDIERRKIVDDLLTANAVLALSLYPRTPIPDARMGGGTVPIHTDWNTAVLMLQLPSAAPPAPTAQ